MASADEAFFDAISKGDLPSVNSLLESGEVRVTNIHDPNMYTPLHFACLSGNEVLVEYLLSHVESHYPREELVRWVNLPNNEDFTPVCFACFRGNLVTARQKLVGLLERAGAQLKLQNARKLELMHVAAQGNQPAVIAYLIEKSFEINPKDVKGGTPLHWAAFMGCELAASLLLAMQAAVNDQDTEGQTPLHLAALAGNVKIVRCLLVKGADRSIKVGAK